ncbi:MAG: hypothetical protein ACI4TD_09730, partial [Phocaeicola sp.]
GDMIGRLNKYIEFSSSSDRFTVDHKSIGSDTLRFEVNVNGYSDVSYLWNNNAGLIVDESKKTEPKFTVSIPHDNNYDSVVISVTVTYTDEGETKTIRHNFELTPINVTKLESYLGVLNSIPSGDYIAATESKAIAGDWFVLRSTNTMYVLDFSYTDSETGSHWKPFTGDMDSSWPLEKVADAMFDMIQIGNTTNTNATMIGVFKALCANSAFIKFLKTRNLTVESSNGNFKFYVKTTNDYGEDLVNPIVEVWYNGTVIFKINPENGNIFFGTPNSDYTAPVSGFMYDATNQRIMSKDNKVVINSNGEIIATNGSFSGNINATSGSFTGTLSGASGMFKGSFITPSLESRPVGETNIKSVTIPSDASSQHAKLMTLGLSDREMYPCSFSGNADIKYVSYSYTNSYKIEYWLFNFYNANGEKINGVEKNTGGGINYYSNLSSGTLNVGATGDVLIFKGIPVSNNGLVSGQIYRNSSNQLFIVP